MLHHAYNDYYYRNNNNKKIGEKDIRLFHDNAIWLIDNAISDNVLKAEFYREIGEFEVANDILKSVEVNDDFIKSIVSLIQEKLNNNDCKVFKLPQQSPF